jgi:hypothetical protein
MAAAETAKTTRVLRPSPSLGGRGSSETVPLRGPALSLLILFLCLSNVQAIRTLRLAGGASTVEQGNAQSDVMQHA